jgi:hypothetical protein
VTRPGRTADEAAEEAGVQLPALRAELSEAARIFDEVRYGNRPATAEQDQFLRQVDAEVRKAHHGVLAGELAPIETAGTLR